MSLPTKEPRKLRALRLRTRHANLVFWAEGGSERAKADLAAFLAKMTDEEIDLVLREDLVPVEA